MKTLNQYILLKAIDRSVLNDGFNIPVEQQENFYELLGEHLEHGEERDIILLIGSKSFTVRLKNINFVRENFPGHHDLLQVRYSKNSEIAEELRHIFSTTVQYIEKVRTGAPRERIIIPDEYAEQFALYATAVPGVFSLEPYCKNTAEGKQTEAHQASIKDFLYYLQCITHLHTAKLHGQQAPHKPLLLLSVIDLVEQGIITDHHIRLSEQLVRTFDHNATRYISSDCYFTPNIGQPFFHLQYEPFWRLVPSMEQIFKVAEEPLPYASKQHPSYNVNTLRLQYRYAEIDPELFDLLQDADVRAKLRVAIIREYF